MFEKGIRKQGGKLTFGKVEKLENMPLIEMTNKKFGSQTTALNFWLGSQTTLGLCLVV